MCHAIKLGLGRPEWYLEHTVKNAVYQLCRRACDEQGPIRAIHESRPANDKAWKITYQKCYPCRDDDRDASFALCPNADLRFQPNHILRPIIR